MLAEIPAPHGFGNRRLRRRDTLSEGFWTTRRRIARPRRVLPMGRQVRSLALAGQSLM